MNTKDAIDMANRCREKIETLRRRLTEVEPKAHAYDTLSATIRLLSPAQSQGYGEDFLWKLNKQIAELEAQNVSEQIAKPRDGQNV